MNDFVEALMQVAAAEANKEQLAAEQSEAGRQLYAALEELNSSMVAHGSSVQMNVVAQLGDSALKIVHPSSGDTELLEFKVNGDLLEMRFLGESRPSQMLTMDSIQEINTYAARAVHHSQDGVPTKEQLGGMIRLWD